MALNTLEKNIASGISSVIYDGVQQTVANEIRQRIQGQHTSPDTPFAEKWESQKKEIIAAGEITYNKFDPALVIKNLVTLEEIRLQFVPKALEYRPESSFIALSSMGRNNPFYQYTGSEDSLAFEIDWFFEKENTEDVIERCKKLEAMSKNDGYNNAPPTIKLLWNNTLFNDSVWVMTSAIYTLSHWNGKANMLPRQALQQVILKKVTNFNYSHDDIRRLNS